MCIYFEFKFFLMLVFNLEIIKLILVASKMCEDAQDLSYFGRADGQCEKFSILNLRCRGLHAWVEIDQSHLLP